ncbi:MULTISPECIES: DUF6701 domain-containing protein [unclassified Pseudoalteromonas]|uniref:DUF6701 domain-containing protein n=1 Tax=unclassified Pseudoalteromonas TaxID=194690 RepID=UPI0005A6E154|nr:MULTISPECIES: DUF6701 domain-containing protein [unclassified Pseudoalteromonas]
MYKKQIVKLFISYICLLFISFTAVALPKCVEVFPGGVATFDNSDVILRNKVKINDNNNGQIITQNLTISAGNGNGNQPKCDSVTCYKSNSDAISSDDSLSIPSIINDGSTTTLPTNLNGDYFIQSQQVNMLTNYTVSGPTRIFIESGIVGLDANLTITGRVNNNGSPSDLLIYIKGNLSTASNAKVFGYVYLSNYAVLGSKTKITGALTTGGGADLGNQSVVNYITPPDLLSGVCGNTFTEYRFDETNFSGVDAILDSSGNNLHATATNVQPVDGLLCNAADFSANSINDYITLNPSAMNGLSDFSVVIWGKSNSSQDSSILSGARDSSAQGTNEAVFYFDNNNEFWPSITTSFFDTGTQLGSTVNMNNGDWHQLVWTRKANTAQSCFYFDGVNQGCVTHSDGDDNDALQIASLILGQEQDDFEGGFDLNQDWEGLLDELIIFDSVLTTTQINDIKTNIEAGNNWNGSTRSCGSLPVAEYRFDELDWNGSAGDVKDSSGNDLHLTSYNASTENTSPVISGTPGFCRYGEFNGINSYLQITTPSSLVGFADEFSVTTWINIDAIPSSGLKSILSKDSNYEFHVNSSGEIFWWWGGGSRSLTTSGANITPGQWHHLAIVYKNGEQHIYVDGVSKATRNTTGTLTLDNDPLQIGQDQGFPGRYFNGSIDEIRIFDKYLTQADVAAIMADTRDCGSVIDHYRIEHDGAGLTCEAETITIKACEDSSCTNLYGSSTTLDFKADGVTQSTPTFSGSTTVSLSQTTIDTLTLSVANETVAASNPLVCINSGSGADCDIAFADAGFKFLYGAANTSTIPTQIAGIDFNTPTDKLKLQAVKDDNGVCTGLFTGNVNIDLAQQSILPGNASTLEFKVNDINIGKNDSSLVSNYTNIQLNFGTDSIATIPTPLYKDAGQIKLHAKYNVGGVSLVGSTDNDFWVRPDKLIVTAKNEIPQELNGSSALSNIVHTAGEDFTLNVSAVNSDGDATPNYSPGQIEFKLTRTGPTLGIVEGSLTYATSSTINTKLAASAQYQNVSLTSFSFGTSTFSEAKYNEVGLLNLDIRDSNYGDDSILVDGDAINIGRFIPDHFTRLTSKTKVKCSSFNYMEQPFKVNYDIAARSLNGTNITQNYIGDFAKGVVSLHIENEGANYKNAEYFGSRLSVQAPSPTWALGHTILTGDDTATLAKAATPDGHFNMADIIMTIIDSDGVEFIADDLDQNPTLPNPSVYTGTKLGSTIDLRYGRLILENSYGSELEDILVPLKAEYWDYITNEFKYNTLDGCTGYLQANLNPLAPNGSHVVLGVDGTLTSGGYPTGFGLSLEKSNVVKSVEVEYSVPAYLQFDWKGDSSQLNPRATIQFGRYRGNDRVIYWREQ